MTKCPVHFWRHFISASAKIATSSFFSSASDDLSWLKSKVNTGEWSDAHEEKIIPVLLQ